MSISVHETNGRRHQGALPLQGRPYLQGTEQRPPASAATFIPHRDTARRPPPASVRRGEGQGHPGRHGPPGHCPVEPHEGRPLPRQKPPPPPLSRQQSTAMPTAHARSPLPPLGLFHPASQRGGVALKK